MGPTELRILLCIGNIALLYKSVVHLFGRAYKLFDVGGTMGISGMLLLLLISVIKNTTKLYRKEPLPETTPKKEASQHAEMVMERGWSRDHSSKTLISPSGARSTGRA